jgi:hypothetical protein
MARVIAILGLLVLLHTSNALATETQVGTADVTCAGGITFNVPVVMPTSLHYSQAEINRYDLLPAILAYAWTAYYDGTGTDAVNTYCKSRGSFLVGASNYRTLKLFVMVP